MVFFFLTDERLMSSAMQLNFANDLVNFRNNCHQHNEFNDTSEISLPSSFTLSTAGLLSLMLFFNFIVSLSFLLLL